jgi:carbon monoxide dehydrogenase subunit G
MLNTIATTIAALLLAFLAYAAMQPDTFHVSRTASIKAPPDKIFPLINDLRAMNTWNPFVKTDPNIKLDYSGPASGKGAANDFDGNSDVGKGRLEILDSASPSKITMKLDMTAPMKAHNTVVFTLAPNGGATDVTWAMDGVCPFMGKVMGVLFNMDKMVGGQFEKGLAELKLKSET